MSRRWVLGVLLLVGMAALADGPADNLPDKVRPIPPAGSPIPDADRTELGEQTQALGAEIDKLRKDLAGKPALLELLPDVQIFHNAARYALAHNEFFANKNGSPRDVAPARNLLKLGRERAKALAEGKSPWTTATGLIVRGYVSRIDGSVQPYGLVVPASFRPDGTHRHRLDVWCHGRGETLTEVNFLDGRLKNPGEFTPPHAFVLHPYGRYCNANKFAGEIDLLEGLDHVRKHYPIDDDRLVMRGFSMGGAACWQFAVHYPSKWVAAAPGAGFSETPDFLKVFQKETLQPTWYEKKLWALYDCPGYARNFANLPVVAYSGEIDSQKQAADVMAEAMSKEGLSLVHVIGPKTGHSYHPQAKREINDRIDAIAARGRDRLPEHVRFATYTLRYPESFWVRLDGLGRHWEQATVDAEIKKPSRIEVQTRNVTALTLAMPSGYCPLDPLKRPTVALDGQEVEAAAVGSDRSWEASFHRDLDTWKSGPPPDGLRKRHGLQGPIDDAFMDSFLVVKPTGKPMNELPGKWAAAEMERFLVHWRKHFRGEARVKDDKDVTDADIAAHNLVLWGDPRSNAVLGKVAAKLPIRWDGEHVAVGSVEFSAKDHAPVLVYPNPLNPKRYVVVNSGFTFRDYDYLNNARQVPKLPDWAVIDLTTPPSSRYPGKVKAADFFDESWQLTANKTK